VTQPILETPSASPVYLARRARSENFTVASLLLPATLRRDLLAVYGYARFVDDLGDDTAGDRSALLDVADAELDRAFDGTAGHPVFAALQPAIRAHRLPREPFVRLIEANRWDQRITRYETRQTLLAYCALSANPVGHLVLLVADAASPERMALSDRICTGLQLVEHWQDVAEDLAGGRIYLPVEDMDRFGVRESDLAAPTAGPAVRRLLAHEAEWARALLAAGERLAALLPGRLGFAVAGYAGGGYAALRAMRGAGYDVLAGAPRASRAARLASVQAVAARAAVRRIRRVMPRTIRGERRLGA
jgi:squalene synthase HpnC